MAESSCFNFDFGIKSDDEDLYEDDSVELEVGFKSVIVVDNLPVVPREKFDRLEAVVRKRFSQYGVIKENGFWMPAEEDTGRTRGYCFIEYNTPQEAELAKSKANKSQLDKSHKLAANTFDEIEVLMNVVNEWAPPEASPYTPGENLQHWLCDEKGRDQFVIRSGSDTEVMWNDARQVKADLVHKRAFWTESFVQWSPLGTYLATVHRQGAALWGGAASFNQLMRFAHPQVKLIDFSPGEKYLVTYSSHEPSNPRDTQRVVVNIFDVRTGKLMNDFKGSADEFAFGGSGGFAWPVIRWGGGKEDKYFALLGKNIISVYETDKFTLIDDKPVEVENVADFSWSPADSIIALFVPQLAGGNQPARFLAIEVDRHTKTKKSTYTGFELFRIKERDMPIEAFELDNRNDIVISFAWEPKGHRFAVIHGDNLRPDVSFYSVRGGKVSKLTTLKQKQANALFWSPGGCFVILAGFKGQLEFYNVDELKTMATVEHFMATDVEWDPTGRYVATSVTSVHEMESGFNIWSFNGKLLYHIAKDHLFQFLWRPRPPSLLSPEKEEEIFKNLKVYSKKYEMEDEEILVLSSEREHEKRKQLKEEWERWLNEWKRCHEDEKMARPMLRDGEASDVEAEQREAEELLDVTRDILYDV